MVNPEWSPLLYSSAEHAWLCVILTTLFDRNTHALGSLRPVEFILGVVCQYLANGFDTRCVLDGDDRVFEQRIRTFKRQTDYITSFRGNAADLPSAQSIEECLAVISQISYLENSKSPNELASDALQRFESDLYQSLFDGQNETYASCFRWAARVQGVEIADLNLCQLGLICELSLDPPLPFHPGGESVDWTWQDFHPSLRFHSLLKAIGHVSGSSDDRMDEYDHLTLSASAERLLDCAGLDRCTDSSMIDWLNTYDADTTQWPSEELSFEHTRFSIAGRLELSKTPGVLFDLNRYSLTSSEPSTFYDLPYVLIEGYAQPIEHKARDQLMEFQQQTLNAYLSRATDFYAFGSGRLITDGLPRHDDAGMVAITTRLHEYFESAFHVEVPAIRL